VRKCSKPMTVGRIICIHDDEAKDNIWFEL
jgi:hypothetical protein